jgi:hemoglobin
MLYTGRENKKSHQGMGITQQDWEIFTRHLHATLAHFQVPEAEANDVLDFIESTKADIID